MSEAWFYVAELPERGRSVELDTAEARHAAGSRRLRAGEALTLFDGRGGVAQAELVEVGRRRTTLCLTSARKQLDAGPQRHVASALPKGDRVSVLLGMATQLGMTSFTPLICERSVTRPSDGSMDRWQRIVREACKQSRRAYVPTLLPASSPDALGGALSAGERLLVLDRDGHSARTLVQDGLLDAGTPLTLVVGPEGGLTPDERTNLLAAGAHLIGLGDGVLRIETAVAGGLAIVAALFGEPAKLG